jgi:ATP-dependent RNA helicase DeaD
VDVVVGTPGRVKDHLEKGTLDLATRCKVAVLDEADQMLDMVRLETRNESLPMQRSRDPGGGEACSPKAFAQLLPCFESRHVAPCLPLGLV